MGTYHHGNLKHGLIEAGIRLLNEGGERALTLRAAAAECGVSHAAPYNHFADKEALLQAIDDYVTQRFLAALQAAVETSPYMHDRMFELGCAYVHFFMENPQYYSFLFLRRRGRGTGLRLHKSGVLESDFLPFLLFQETAQAVMDAMKVPPALQAARVLEMWVTVQGITMLYVQEHFVSTDNEEMLRTLLRGRLHIRQGG